VGLFIESAIIIDVDIGYIHCHKRPVAVLRKLQIAVSPASRGLCDSWAYCQNAFTVGFRNDTQLDSCYISHRTLSVSLGLHSETSAADTFDFQQLTDLFESKFSRMNHADIRRSWS